MPIGGKRVSTCDNGKRDKNFDLIVVDPFEKIIGKKSNPRAEGNSSEYFDKKHFTNISNGNIVTAVGNPKKGQKDNDTDSIIKKRLAHNFGFEALSDIRLLQNSQHSYRISRGDQRTKKQAIDKLGLNPEKRHQKIGG